MPLVKLNIQDYLNHVLYFSKVVFKKNIQGRLHIQQLRFESFFRNFVIVYLMQARAAYVNYGKRLARLSDAKRRKRQF